jgi:hypothetical protein
MATIHVDGYTMELDKIVNELGRWYVVDVP